MSIDTILSVLQDCKMIDLSLPIRNDMPVFPGHQRTVIFQTSNSEEMRSLTSREILGFNVEGFIMSNHESTHVDAPIHVEPNALPIDQLPLNLFITRGICLDVSHVLSGEYITADDLESAEKKAGTQIKPGDTLLLYTGHYQRAYQTSQWFRHTGLDEEASHWITEKRIVNIGLDAPNIDSSREMKNGLYPAHRILLLENKILIMENLVNLEQIKNQSFIFIGLPLALEGASGSPIRAVALIDG